MLHVVGQWTFHGVIVYSMNNPVGSVTQTNRTCHTDLANIRLLFFFFAGILYYLHAEFRLRLQKYPPQHSWDIKILTGPANKDLPNWQVELETLPAIWTLLCSVFTPSSAYYEGNYDLQSMM